MDFEPFLAAKDIIKVKDKFGHTHNVVSINFKGEDLYAPAPFDEMNGFIGRMDEFKSRQDDIWINSYVKAGKYK